MWALPVNGSRWCSQTAAKLDVLDQDHLVVLLGERLLQVLARVGVQAGEHLGVHAGDAGRRLGRPSRSGSSPTARRISRTAASMRAVVDLHVGIDCVCHLRTNQVNLGQAARCLLIIIIGSTRRHALCVVLIPPSSFIVLHETLRHQPPRPGCRAHRPLRQPLGRHAVAQRPGVAVGRLRHPPRRSPRRIRPLGLADWLSLLLRTLADPGADGWPDLIAALRRCGVITELLTDDSRPSPADFENGWKEVRRAGGLGLDDRRRLASASRTLSGQRRPVCCGSSWPPCCRRGT